MAAPSVSAGSKVCVNCGKNVTGQKRMRDSEGKYWCLACGQADQAKKRAGAGVACAGCRASFPANKLTTMGSLQYCKKCYKKRTNHGPGLVAGISGIFSSFGGGGGGGETDKKKIVMMLLAAAALAAISLYVNMG